MSTNNLTCALAYEVAYGHADQLRGLRCCAPTGPRRPALLTFKQQPPAQPRTNREPRTTARNTRAARGGRRGRAAGFQLSAFSFQVSVSGEQGVLQASRSKEQGARARSKEEQTRNKLQVTMLQVISYKLLSKELGLR
jgi:hypothetical protein